MSGFYRYPPKEIAQDKTKFTCWAAALASWMSVTPSCPMSWLIKTQEDAIEEWKDFTDDKSGLSVKKGFQWMASACSMNAELFKPARRLTGDFIYSKLRSKGYLYIFFAGGQMTSGNGLAHASVIYGISNPWSSDCVVGVIDPWNGENRTGENLKNYQRAGEILVAWLEL